jgi:hypothetical protein
VDSRCKVINDGRGSRITDVQVVRTEKKAPGRRESIT